MPGSVSGLPQLLESERARAKPGGIQTVKLELGPVSALHAAPQLGDAKRGGCSRQLARMMMEQRILSLCTLTVPFQAQSHLTHELSCERFS